MAMAMATGVRVGVPDADPDPDIDIDIDIEAEIERQLQLVRQADETGEALKPLFSSNFDASLLTRIENEYEGIANADGGRGRGGNAAMGIDDAETEAMAISDPLDELIAAIEKRNIEQDMILDSYNAMVGEMTVQARSKPVWSAMDVDVGEARAGAVAGDAVAASPGSDVYDFDVGGAEEVVVAPAKVELEHVSAGAVKTETVEPGVGAVEPAPASTSATLDFTADDAALAEMEAEFERQAQEAARREAERAAEREAALAKIETDRLARAEALAVRRAQAIRDATARQRAMEAEERAEREREAERRERVLMRRENRRSARRHALWRAMRIRERRAMQVEEAESMKLAAIRRHAALRERRAMGVQDRVSRVCWERTARQREADRARRQVEREKAALFVARREAQLRRDRRVAVLHVLNAMRNVWRRWRSYVAACELERLSRKPKLQFVVKGEGGAGCWSVASAQGPGAGSSTGTGDVGVDVWAAFRRWQGQSANVSVNTNVNFNLGAATRVELRKRREEEKQKENVPITEGVLSLACGVGLAISSGSVGSDSDLAQTLAGVVSLALSLEGITDMSGLGTAPPMPKLQSLSLNANALTRVEGLDGLSTLRELSLRDNQIYTLQGLKNTCLPLLSHLRLDINRLSSLEGLEKTLAASRSRSMSKSKSKSRPNAVGLQVLRLDHNTLGPELSGLPSTLVRLGLCDNRVSCIDLGSLLSVQHLDIGRNQLTDAGIVGLESCALLRSLLVYQNGVTLEHLAVPLPLLQELWLSRNNIRDVGVARLSDWWIPMLVQLNLSDNAIQHLPPTMLASCPNLESLDVAFNDISSLDSLAALRPCCRLQTLQMHDNPVADHVNYKAAVLGAAPSLSTLDHLRVPRSARRRQELGFGFGYKHGHMHMSSGMMRIRATIAGNGYEDAEMRVATPAASESLALYLEMCHEQIKESSALRSAQMMVERRYAGTGDGDGGGGTGGDADAEGLAPVWMQEQHSVLLTAMARRHLRDHRHFDRAKWRNRVVSNDGVTTRYSFFRVSAVLRIQALWRAWRVRSRADNPWRARREEWRRERDATKNSAATLLQSVLRGHRVRKIVDIDIDLDFEDGEGYGDGNDDWWDNLPDISPPVSPVPPTLPLSLAGGHLDAGMGAGAAGSAWDDGVAFEGGFGVGLGMNIGLGGEYWSDVAGISIAEIEEIDRELELIDANINANADADADADADVYYDGIDDVLPTPRRDRLSAKAKAKVRPGSAGAGGSPPGSVRVPHSVSHDGYGHENHHGYEDGDGDPGLSAADTIRSASAAGGGTGTGTGTGQVSARASAKMEAETDKLAAEWGFKDKAAARAMAKRQLRMQRGGRADDRRRAVDPNLRGTKRFEMVTLSEDVVSYAYADRKNDLQPQRPGGRRPPSAPWGSALGGARVGGGTRGGGRVTSARGGRPPKSWMAEMRSDGAGRGTEVDAEAEAEAVPERDRPATTQLIREASEPPRFRGQGQGHGRGVALQTPGLDLPARPSQLQPGLEPEADVDADTEVHWPTREERLALKRSAARPGSGSGSGSGSGVTLSRTRLKAKAKKVKPPRGK